MNRHSHNGLTSDKEGHWSKKQKNKYYLQVICAKAKSYDPMVTKIEYQISGKFLNNVYGDKNYILLKYININKFIFFK